MLAEKLKQIEVIIDDKEKYDQVVILIQEMEEVERDYRAKRQADGIAAARERGGKFGRPQKPLPRNFKKIYECYQKDIKILVKILKDNSINTRPKTLEAIRHYQTLIPRNLEITSQVISVIAIAISLIALIFDDKIFYSAENLAIALVFFILIIILYLAFRSYNKILLKMFGKYEFYKRLELTLSDIYMRSLIK